VVVIAACIGKYTIIGTTKDDAAGEAFDKFAKMMGLPFPGGVNVDRLSKNGDRRKYDFPRGLIHEKNLMMSFSGLKSAAHRLLSKMQPQEIKSEEAHLCASFQEAVVETLVEKMTLAARLFRTKKIAITGGVSANSRLREEAENLKAQGYQIVIPPLRYCTDNAAMIGYAGILRLNAGERSKIDLGPSSGSYEDDFTVKLREQI
jgi:N6-L-threonylcarbamoyladenine synthase